MYKGNKNLRTSAFMKIIMYYKLNNYNTRDDRTDISAYCNILALACEEVCYIANGDFENEDIGIDNFKNKDINIGDFEDKDVSINNFENEDISVNNFEDKDIGINNSA